MEGSTIRPLTSRFDVRWERTTVNFKYVTKAQCQHLSSTLLPKALSLAAESVQPPGTQSLASVLAVVDDSQLSSLDTAIAEELYPELPNPEKLMHIAITIRYWPSNALYPLLTLLEKHLARQGWNTFDERVYATDRRSTRPGGFKVWLDLRGSSVSESDLISSLTNIVLQEDPYLGGANMIKSRDKTRSGLYELILHPGAHALESYKQLLQANLQGVIQARLTSNRWQVSLKSLDSSRLQGIDFYVQATITPSAQQHESQAQIRRQRNPDGQDG